MPAKRRKLNMTGRKRFHIPGASSEEELIQDLNNGTGIFSLKCEDLMIHKEIPWSKHRRTKFYLVDNHDYFYKIYILKDILKLNHNKEFFLKNPAMCAINDAALI